MSALWMTVVFTFSLAAACTDLRSRRIPRLLAVAAAAAGLTYHFIAGGLPSALLALALGLTLGVVLFQVGAIGGGDAKWLAALGALLGLRLWFWSLELGFIAAGALGLAQLIRAGKWRDLPNRWRAILGHLQFWGWRAHPEYNVSNPASVRAPLAVALGVGVACACVFF